MVSSENSPTVAAESSKILGQSDKISSSDNEGTKLSLKVKTMLSSW